MRVNVWRDERNGISYVNVRSEDLVDAVVSVGLSRITIKGYPSVTIMKGSQRHGDQIQFQLHQKADEKARFPALWEKREAQNYERVEFYVPINVGIEMLKLALEECQSDTREKSWREIFSVKQPGEL